MITQEYTEDDGMKITVKDSPYFEDKTIVLDAEELENLERHAYEYEKNRERLHTRPHELAEMFPEARTYLNARKRGIKKELQGLLERDREINAKYSDFKDKETREFMLSTVERQRQSLLSEMKNNDLIVSFMGGGQKRGKDMALNLQRAKDYPIDQLVKVKHNKALCVWHNDTNPSMHYYRKTNKVYCFSCNKGGDAIDVVMQMKGCELPEAVAFLTGE